MISFDHIWLLPVLKYHYFPLWNDHHKHKMINITNKAIYNVSTHTRRIWQMIPLTLNCTYLLYESNMLNDKMLPKWHSITSWIELALFSFTKWSLPHTQNDNHYDVSTLSLSTVKCHMIPIIKTHSVTFLHNMVIITQTKKYMTNKEI